MGHLTRAMAKRVKVFVDMAAAPCQSCAIMPAPQADANHPSRFDTDGLENTGRFHGHNHTGHVVFGTGYPETLSFFKK